MSDKDRRQLLAKMKRTARTINNDSAAAKKVLRQTGIYTPAGKLKRDFS